MCACARHSRFIAAFALLSAVAGCAHSPSVPEAEVVYEQPMPPARGALVHHANYDLAPPVADPEGPYTLDTGDRLRIFVYGQPNLSRAYVVDHEGRIAVPLIGQIDARGRTTQSLEHVIRDRLGAEFVRDPQVTVDIIQNRPFFIYGEVKAAGQYPFVSGMTIETAIAIAGGYSERASHRSYRITRRANGFVEEIVASGDYPVQPGDTVYVRERFF